MDSLREAGLVNRVRSGIKLLGEGEISHPMVIRVDKVSMVARAKIEAAGGKVDLI